MKGAPFSAGSDRGAAVDNPRRSGVMPAGARPDSSLVGARSRCRAHISPADPGFRAAAPRLAEGAISGRVVECFLGLAGLWRRAPRRDQRRRLDASTKGAPAHWAGRDDAGSLPLQRTNHLTKPMRERVLGRLWGPRDLTG